MTVILKMKIAVLKYMTATFLVRKESDTIYAQIRSAHKLEKLEKDLKKL